MRSAVGSSACAGARWVHVHRFRLHASQWHQMSPNPVRHRSPGASRSVSSGPRSASCTRPSGVITACAREPQDAALSKPEPPAQSAGRRPVRCRRGARDATPLTDLLQERLAPFHPDVAFSRLWTGCRMDVSIMRPLSQGCCVKCARDSARSLSHGPPSGARLDGALSAGGQVARSAAR